MWEVVTGPPPALLSTTIMALPTNGRVIIDTTVGEIEIELWSKVCYLTARLSCLIVPTGNTENMSQLSGIGYGGSVSLDLVSERTC